MELKRSAELKCNSCTNTISRNEKSVPCSGFCTHVFHRRCVNLTDYDVTLLSANKNLRFLCDECGECFVRLGMILKLVDENKKKKTLIKQEEEIKSILKCVKQISASEKSSELNTKSVSKSVNELKFELRLFSDVLKREPSVCVYRKKKNKNQTKLGKN